jgi:ArsR family transcriptional regulator
MATETRTKPRTTSELRIIGGTENSACCVPVVHPDMEGVARRAKVLAAISDPTRLGIVEMLAAMDDSLCVCEIVSEFSLGQPTISHHLKVLRESGLVKWEKRGLWVYYSLNREAMGNLGAHITGLVSAGK